MVLLFAGGDALNHIPHPSWHVLPFAGLYSAVPSGQCQPLLHLVTLPARNIALSLFQTSLSQSPLDTQLEWATRRRVPMFKVVPNIFWSSWCRWWWNAENMGNLECKGSVFVRPAFSCFALCRCRNSILPQHHAAFLFPIWGYGASKQWWTTTTRRREKEVNPRTDREAKETTIYSAPETRKGKLQHKAVWPTSLSNLWKAPKESYSKVCKGGEGPAWF